jgi:hypothetical protein
MGIGVLIVERGNWICACCKNNCCCSVRDCHNSHIHCFTYRRTHLCRTIIDYDKPLASDTSLGNIIKPIGPRKISNNTIIDLPQTHSAENVDTKDIDLLLSLKECVPSNGNTESISIPVIHEKSVTLKRKLCEINHISGYISSKEILATCEGPMRIKRKLWETNLSNTSIETQIEYCEKLLKGGEKQYHLLH